ncbi:uncharacterized protein LOC109621439 [Aedes albopictus]|uniref:Ultrahigh sulfur keratin-associated protein n=1 Tax=Aedes albopictus TaxID=7160 RepID=A0ABM1YR68_AEDAL|nr:heavy metal-associated isoprenylated plant protein 32-like [Aedes albopictus]XP_029732229.1 heavy metal-associated isoprenylated plant protein 32-like [Aedes albopictus]XP_029732232.1 heavy metal-associated isoprenylated plant protein 32-like [Aedes albopictus]KXJ76095.1 hypothetical protein RP20_CCG010365 [Aedes albopictus]
MKACAVLALAVVCTLLLVDITQAFHDDGKKSDQHIDELQEMLQHSMLPEMQDFPRFRRWAEEGSDQQTGQQGGQQGGGGGGRGGRGQKGRGGSGGRGPPGQQNEGQ